VSPRKTAVTVAALALSAVLTACGGSSYDGAQPVDAAGGLNPSATDAAPAAPAASDAVLEPTPADDAAAPAEDGSGADGDAGASDPSTAAPKPVTKLPAAAQAKVQAKAKAQAKAKQAARKKAAAKPAPGPAGKAAPARVASKLVARQLPRMGSVVADQAGRVMYRFDKDRADPPTSTCAGACVTAWPPVVVTGRPAVEGVDARLTGMIKRADGSWQLTLAGWPLYYFAKDVTPGDWKGQGVGGVWFAAAPDGSRNTNCLPPAAPPATGAAPRAATELVAKDVPDLGRVVVDQNGSVLYRFDRDRPDPPTSTCAGACLAAWPAVTVTGIPTVRGIDPQLVGMLRRPDGSWQVTLGGRPLYYFAKDTEPGQWKGQGAGGVWFAVTRDGRRNRTMARMSGY
jgi:predicted lipoprotein with Yx(FWY)xxD motif